MYTYRVYLVRQAHRSAAAFYLFGHLQTALRLHVRTSWCTRPREGRSQALHAAAVVVAVVVQCAMRVTHRNSKMPGRPARSTFSIRALYLGFMLYGEGGGGGSCFVVCSAAATATASTAADRRNFRTAHERTFIQNTPPAPTPPSFVLVCACIRVYTVSACFSVCLMFVGDIYILLCTLMYICFMLRACL